MSTRFVFVALLALTLAACVAPPPRSARLSISLLSGSAPGPTSAATHVAVVLDAGEDMAELSQTGPSYWIGARRGAERLIGSLPLETRADLLLVGGASDASCKTVPERLIGPEAVASRLAQATPAGSAALALTLEQLAEQADTDAELTRAVVFTRLSQACGGDLCAAAQHLASRDVRLDLVVIGDAQPPACLAEITQRDLASPPRGWSADAHVPFHVSSPSLDPGLHLCGEAHSTAIPVPPGRATVVVALDPPLRVERSFAPGSRWQLEVLDFPALDPPVREWRWQELPPEPEPRRAR